MKRARVLVTLPNDFRKEAREQFATSQRSDALLFAETLQGLGCEVMLLSTDLVEPRSAYLAVKAAIAEFKPDCVIMRCYLWADPPNGMAVIQAVPLGMPIAASAYIAPEGAPLGEAPGEVFQLHIACAARMVGRHVERLFGPLQGTGQDETIADLREFVEQGRVVSNVDFPEFALPITAEHTAKAQAILDDMRGRIIAATGGPAMGMVPCRVSPTAHMGSGSTGGWGLSDPIISPDLYLWMNIFHKREQHYMSLGQHYVQAMTNHGFQFKFQHDFDGRRLPSNELDYNPNVAAFQMGLYAAMLDISRDMNIDILLIPAQLVMSDFVVCGDLIKGVAMSTWGPEGRQGELDWMTEGDADAGISHRVLRQTTGHVAAFADVRCRIPTLGQSVWKMVNSGACGAEIAENGWASCYSVRQYSGYFRVKGGGGTFAFMQPKKCSVVGLRVGVDQQGVYGTVAIGRTVQSTDSSQIVDGRWPQLNVDVFDNSRKIVRAWPTNHYHWSESDKPMDDACVLHEAVRLAAGGNADRVKVLYDGRTIG